MNLTNTMLSTLMAGAMLTITHAHAAEKPAAPAEAAKPAAAKIDTTSKTFSVKLGATRLVYNMDSSGATLVVSNPQDYPMLVQSKVLAENRKDPAPFLLTPPLFRLDGNQQSRIKVIRTGGTMAADRETLQWLCVTGIPPKPDDVWGKKEAAPNKATIEVQYRIQSCIKLLVRPGSLKSTSADEAGSLTWKREGNKLKVSNPTPYYMTMREVLVGKTSVKTEEYIPPFGSMSYPLAAGASGQVEWKVITDYGGDSRQFKAALQ